MSGLDIVLVAVVYSHPKVCHNNGISWPPRPTIGACNDLLSNTNRIKLDYSGSDRYSLRDKQSVAACLHTRSPSLSLDTLRQC